MFEIRKYTASAADEWNAFVEKSKNGTFLFDRRYMDYHAERFSDASLMVYRSSRLVALLPANHRETTLYSHQGLTYGGLITDSKCSAGMALDIFERLNEHLRRESVRRIVYKALPWIYHRLPSEESLYALHTVCRSTLISRDISSAVDLRCPLRFTESRRSGLRKAQNNGLTVSESGDMAAFWHILNDNLQHKYGKQPVHSLEELHLLRDRFPRNIRLFMVCQGEKTLGGTLLYLTDRVIHTQYISASAEGKKLGALDLLFDFLIYRADFSQYYLDFGKSTDKDCFDLNMPLLFQKEGFGGRAVCYDTYEWQP